MAQGSDSGSDDLNYRRNTLNTLFRHERVTDVMAQGSDPGSEQRI
jgi:hypothetical protein